MRRVSQLTWLIFAIISWWSTTAEVRPEVTIRGVVFEDVNRNNVRDANESGIANVIVTDGNNVVHTDANGRYLLRSRGMPTFVYITQPSGYTAIGRWYHRLRAPQLASSASGEFEVNFALVRERQERPFIFVQATDIHMTTEATLDRVRAFVADINRMRIRPAFVVVTGDLVAGSDATPLSTGRTWYRLYKRAWENLTVTAYHVVGNHDVAGVNVRDESKVNRLAPDYGKGMFEAYLHPRYYGFEYANVHFIVLDVHPIYDRRLGVGLDATEWQWLRRYIKHVKVGIDLILFSHAPLLELPARQAWWLNANLRWFRFLGAFAGHHHRTYEVSFAPFYSLTVTGALSGSWWGGPNPDGTPQGYRIIRVDEAGVRHYYIPAWYKCGALLLTPPLFREYSGCHVMPVWHGRQRMRVQVTEIFTDVQRVRARLGVGRWANLHKLWTEYELVSLWEGELDTTTVTDGLTPLTLEVSDGVESETVQYQVLINNRSTAYKPSSDALLTMLVRGLERPAVVMANGHKIAQLKPMKDANREVQISVKIPRKVLTSKVLTIAIKPSAIDRGQIDDFTVRSPELTYGKMKINDAHLRGTMIIGDDSDDRLPEGELIFVLP